jgi:oxalate decarboxylase/phosphoglucose isomerase-like protein (cupin superfamily)
MEGAVAQKFPYSQYMEREGIPVHEAVVGVEDVTQLPRGAWSRTGGLGTFIQLQGTFESQRGIYVAEIPGGGALEPEKHLYEEQIFVLHGRGAAQVWQGDRERLTFEWNEGSVVAFPRNTWHRLYNTGREPVIFMGVTSAPEVMNALDDLEYVFNSDYAFGDLYEGDGRYFIASDKRVKTGWYQGTHWYTHFIPDARLAALDALEQKVAGGQLTGYRMGKRFPHGHISAWPAGRYHKAHYHGPGAILLGLDGEGYVLAWPSEWGPRPYESVYGDRVYKVHWGRNSIYSPPNAYFHQHFNSGPGPAKHVAVYGADLPLGVHDMTAADGWKGFLTFREGGTLIEYRDEDPQIRKEFRETIGQRGIENKMPDELYE